MNNTHKKLKRAVIKEELVAITGDLEKAIILNQMLYWSERIYDFDKFITEERERVENEGKEDLNLELQNGWIYKDMEELKEEVMFTSSISTLSRKLKSLIDSGYLDRRRNPKYDWDKTYQYRVNLNKIAIDLYKKGYNLQGYKYDLSSLISNSHLQNESSNLQNESRISDTIETLENAGLSKSDILEVLKNSNLQNASSIFQNERAIPEITTETTNYIKNVSTDKNKNKDSKELKEVRRENHSPNDSKKEEKSIYSEESQEYKIVCYLIDKIKENNDRQPTPEKDLENSNFRKWILDIDRLHRLGVPGGKKGYSYMEIKNLIDFSQRDSFWSGNILSASKLREKATTLENQAKQRGNIAPNSPQKKTGTAKKTRFHNFEQRSDNYTSDDIEKITQRKREEFKKRMKQGFSIN